MSDAEVPEFLRHAARCVVGQLTNRETTSFAGKAVDPDRGAALRVVALLPRKHGSGPGTSVIPYYCAELHGPVVEVGDEIEFQLEKAALPNDRAATFLPKAPSRSSLEGWQREWKAAKAPEALIPFLADASVRRGVREIALLRVEVLEDFFILVYVESPQPLSKVFRARDTKAELSSLQAMVSTLSSIAGVSPKFVPFWEWFYQTFQHASRIWKIIGIGATALVPAAVGYAVGWLRAPPEHWVLGGAIANAAVIVTALALFPSRDEAEKMNVRLAKACRMWFHRLFVVWLVFYVVVACRALAAQHGNGLAECPASMGWEIWLSALTGGLSFLVAACALGCYFSLTKRAPSSPAIAVAVLVGLVATGHPFARLIGSCELVQGLRATVGIGEGVALALLVGRLDSRLFGTPGFVSSLLFAYAVMQSLHAELFRPPGATLAVLVIAAVLLKLLLFLVIRWLFATGALAFYLDTIEKLVDIVPRRSLEQVMAEAAGSGEQNHR